jgi:mRNA interferase MazF
LLPSRVSGLRAESVINVSQLVALDRRFLTDRVGKIPAAIQAYVDAGLRLVLELDNAFS